MAKNLRQPKCQVWCSNLVFYLTLLTIQANLWLLPAAAPNTPHVTPETSFNMAVNRQWLIPGGNLDLFPQCFGADARFSEVPAGQTKLCAYYSLRGTGEWCLVSAESCRCALGYLCLTGYMWKCTGPAHIATCRLEVPLLAVCVEHCLTPPSLLSVLIYNPYHKSF